MARISIIIVMGVTGVGKSTFIQHATGTEVKIGHGQEACTAEVKMYPIPDTDVYLVDTPGFDDTYISDTEILKSIAAALIDAFNDQADIKGALYIHPVTEAKMRGSGRKNLLMFRSLLGMDTMQNCRLVTTKWSLQDRKVSEARERELCDKKEFWQPLLEAGARTVRFEDSMRSAINIIKPLVNGPPCKPLLAREMIEQGLQTEDTSAGIEINADLERAKKKHLAEMKVLKEDSERATGAMRELIEAERADHQAALERIARDQADLRTPISRSSGSGRLGRWIVRGAAWLSGTAMTVVSGGLLAPAAALLIAGTEVGAQVHKHS